MSLDQAIPNSSSFFRNVDCAYFPCHEGVEEGSFNCLFCYCPLYALGPSCGGHFTYTSSGVKDCSGYTRLHDGDGGVAIVRDKFAELVRLAAIANAAGDEA